MAAIKQLAGEFFKAAAASPTSIALRFYDKSTSTWREYNWKEYERQVRKVAAWLQAQGINRGDRVALMSANRPEWLITDLAIFAVGAISVPIYATASRKDVEHILVHSEAKALFVDHEERLKVAGDVTLPQILV